MEDRNDMFEQTMLPHLDAAYNLARWLAGNDHDAEDIVQESFLRALKFFGSFRGGNARAWLLTIVRNTSYTWLSRRRAASGQVSLAENDFEIEDAAVNPDVLLAVTAKQESVRAAIAKLPAEFREVIVLRELDGHSYQEIADITETPVGTVMSRLARARRRLQQILVAEKLSGGSR